MKLLIFGATGMVGSEVLTAALNDSRITSAISIGRRETGQTHPKLKEIVHGDFLNYGAIADVLADADACVFCLATYQSKVSKAAYEEITIDYPTALIHQLEEINPSIRFCLFSAAGADPSGKSAASFARIKGRTELALTQSKLTHRHIFRPGLIVPGPSRRAWYWPAGLLEVLFRLLPGAGLDAADLGRAMVDIAVTGDAPELLENSAIRKHLR